MSNTALKAMDRSAAQGLNHILVFTALNVTSKLLYNL